MKLCHALAVLIIAWLAVIGTDQSNVDADINPRQTEDYFGIDHIFQLPKDVIITLN